MKATTFLAIGASLASLAAAAPFNKKRAVVYTTVTEEVVTTIWSTTTLWTDPTSTPVSKVGIFAESYASPAVASVSTPVAAAAVASSAKVEVSVAKPTTSTPVAAPVETYVAPIAPTSTYVAPAPAPVASTSVAAAVAASSPAAAASSPAAAAASPVSNVASSSGSYPNTGEITYYDVSVGLGSCGVSGSNSQDLVAVGKDMMANGINPNANPKCGKQIEISYQGKTHTATIFDTCPTCSGGSLDLTESLFKKVAPNGDGRVAGVSWRYVN